MRHTIWRWLGFVGYWLLLPLIYVYASATKPRTRVLLIQDNDVLLVKNWLGAGNWSLPGGGLEVGESPAEAASREVDEELGILIEPDMLQPLGVHKVRERGGLKSKYHLFAVQLVERPELVIKSNEIMGTNWYSVADVAHAGKGISNTVKQSVTAWLDRQNLVS